LRDAEGGAGGAEEKQSGRSGEGGSNRRREAEKGSWGWGEGEGRRGRPRQHMAEALEETEEEAGMDAECVSWLLSLVCYDRHV